LVSSVHHIHVWRNRRMGEVARVTEITARSSKGWEDAVHVGLSRANDTLRGIKSAWIKEQKVEIKDGEISAYQVDMLVTFVLDEDDPVR
jgi:flavin-binding protein dodecin